MSINGPLAGSSKTSEKSDRMYKNPDAKRTKNNRLKAEALKWRAIETSGAMLDEGGGMMMLEEVDGVGVEWEEDGDGGRKAVLVVSRVAVN